MINSQKQSRKKRHGDFSLGARYSERPTHGVYAVSIQCPDGRWKVELTDEGWVMALRHINKYPNLCSKVFQNYSGILAVARACDPNVSHHDHPFQEAARLGVIRSVITFDESLGSFSTHVMWFIRSHLSHACRKRLHPLEVKTRTSSSYASEDSTEWDSLSQLAGGGNKADPSDRVRHAEVLEPWLKRLPRRERIIVESRFGIVDGVPKTLAQVACEFGITRERVRQLECVALARLWKYAHESGEDGSICE